MGRGSRTRDVLKLQEVLVDLPTGWEVVDYNPMLVRFSESGQGHYIIVLAQYGRSEVFVEEVESEEKAAGMSPRRYRGLPEKACTCAQKMCIHLQLVEAALRMGFDRHAPLDDSMYQLRRVGIGLITLQPTREDESIPLLQIQGSAAKVEVHDRYYFGATFTLTKDLTGCTCDTPKPCLHIAAVALLKRCVPSFFEEVMQAAYGST